MGCQLSKEEIKCLRSNTSKAVKNVTVNADAKITFEKSEGDLPFLRTSRAFFLMRGIFRIFPKGFPENPEEI